MSVHQAEILIVGAGVAGLSAAEAFLDAGWRVRVVDKARKPGGRCATRRIHLDRQSAWFDAGAQYFTARDSEFCAWLQPWLQQDAVAPWQAQLGRGRPAVAEPVVDEQCRYAGVGGMNAWLATWSERLQSRGMELFCQARVAQVRAEGQQVVLHFEDGRVWEAAQVLLSAPAEQTRALWPPLQQLPQWPQLGPCLAMSVLARPSWDWDGLFSPHPEVAWMACNSSKPGAIDTSDPLWTLHAGPALSQLACTDKDHAEEQLLRIAEEIMGVEVIPQHVHLWRYATAPREVYAQGYFQDPQWGQVTIAGDWLNGGRIEGAWLSGLAAARACIAKLDLD